jgi:hypothetical protein
MDDQALAVTIMPPSVIDRPQAQTHAGHVSLRNLAKIAGKLSSLDPVGHVAARQTARDGPVGQRPQHKGRWPSVPGWYPTRS